MTHYRNGTLHSFQTTKNIALIKQNLKIFERPLRYEFIELCEENRSFMGYESLYKMKN